MGEAGTCREGECVVDPLCVPYPCEDRGECIADSCDQGACSYPNAPDGSTCADGSGKCKSGVCDVDPCAQVNCDDTDDCTIGGSCNPETGKCDGGTNAELDAPCDNDGGSVCDGAGTCVECNRASQCRSDEYECTTASCDSNQCGQTPVTDGNECDFTGAPGICEAGECVDANLCAEKDCGDGLECTEDLCDRQTGTCSNPTAPDNTECDGGRGRCEAGLCVDKCAGEDCDDGNDCTSDGQCDSFTGECPPKINEPIDTPCDDGRFCNDQGVCKECTKPGQCDFNECQIPTCEANTCGTDPRPDLTECSGGESVCLNGACGKVFPCTENGIRAAIARGDGPYRFDCAPGTEIAIAAEIVINQDVVLDAEGNLTLNGSGVRRAFVVTMGTSAELRGFIVKNGFAPSGSSQGGGGILINQGALVLRDVQVLESVAELDGGGIHNWYGELTLVNCYLWRNRAYRGAGVASTGPLSISTTTMVENTATLEGGAIAIHELNGELTLERSTLAGNTAGVDGKTGFGGALLIKGASLLRNVTIFNNAAHIGGAMWSNPGTTLVHVTMTNNHTWVAPYGDISGAGRFYLQGTAIDGDCDTGGTYSSRYSLKTTASNCGSGTTQVADLRLGPIADNGGPTWTLYPELGSPVIDVIPEASCTDDYSAGALLTVDQRGSARPQGTSRECDIGAVEFDQ